jgi:hypothetical protein
MKEAAERGKRGAEFLRKESARFVSLLISSVGFRAGKKPSETALRR